MPWPFKTTRLVLLGITLTVALAFMKALVQMAVVALALFGAMAHGQSTRQFEVASIKPSLKRVGPDYNNQFTFLSAGATARNVTLQRLLAEAFQLQLNQVLSPSWIDRNKYDLELSAYLSQDQLSLVLRSLFLERFQLNLADLIALQLIFPALSEDPAKPTLAGGTQTSVVDKPALQEFYNLIWISNRSSERLLQDRFGLRLESKRDDLPVRRRVLQHRANLGDVFRLRSGWATNRTSRGSCRGRRRSCPNQINRFLACVIEDIRIGSLFE